MSDNLPVITVDTFTEIIKSQFNEGDLRPIFGLGKGGIGKTESIEHLAKKELNIGYVDIRLLLYTETDLKGIPYPNENHTSTIWLQNNILPLAERDGEKGILVLDEITSAPKSVRTAAYQLLNERRLGEYNLPAGWLIVCLGNGEEDGGDYQGMEGNFANRCSVFRVVPDIEAWKEWAFKNNINTLVTSYVTFRPNDLHTYNPEAEGEVLFASPRSWTAVSNILNNNDFNDKDNVLICRILANIGQRVGHTFIAFCKHSKKAIDPNSIVKNGQCPKLDDIEIVNITIQSVIKIVSDKIDSDLNNGNEISSEAVQWTANTLKWLVSLRTEYAVMGIKDLVRYNKIAMTKLLIHPSLHQLCPEFAKFAAENKGVFE